MPTYRPKRPVLCFVVACLALAITACSSSGPTTGPSTAPSTVSTPARWQMTPSSPAPPASALPKGAAYWGMVDFTQFQSCDPHPCFFPLRVSPRFDTKAVPGTKEQGYPEEGRDWFPVAYEQAADNDFLSEGRVQNDQSEHSNVWVYVMPYEGHPGGWLAKIWLAVPPDQKARRELVEHPRTS